jgi:hypothetical protein
MGTGGRHAIRTPDLVCLFEAVICHAKYGASAPLDEEKLSEITNRIPAGSHCSLAMGGEQIFAGQGAFLWATEHRHVWIGAKTEDPLRFLRPYVGNNWDYVAI